MRVFSTQAAIDAPRFCIWDGTQGGVVSLEDTLDPSVVEELRAMGHNLEPAAIPGAVPGFPFGRAQVNDYQRSFSRCPEPVLAK